MMNKISCIICAFNEEKRISIVLAALKNHPNIHEVIVVDDGSTDATQEMVKKFPFAKLISHTTNKGKSRAVVTGIKEASHDTLVFLDADILSITPADITNLVRPVLDNKADVGITLRKNSLLLYKTMGLDFVSGERIIHKKYLMDELEKINNLPGFGIEVFMNRLIIKNNLRVKVVDWKDVTIERKTGKVGFWRGVFGEIIMIRQIHKTSSIREIFMQNYRLWKLSKGN